jgi:hypothetical protein
LTQQTLGGAPWSQVQRSEPDEQKRNRRLAQGIIARAQKPSADVAKLAKQAARVSALLQDDAAQFEAQAARYATEIAKNTLAAVMQAKNDALATRQLEQRMIQAQLQAESARQMVDELDVVFMAVMLMALED